MVKIKSMQSFKAGFVALVGKPNVGKSTLLNNLLGEKVSIISSKPQTTRMRMYGILNTKNYQLVFVDTPGICDGNSSLRRMMRRISGYTANSSDIVLVMFDMQKRDFEITIDERKLVDAAKDANAKIIIILNKIDRLYDKKKLLPFIKKCKNNLKVDTVIPISALKKDGLEQLLTILLQYLPQGKRIFPKDMYTDKAERFLCEELIREQILLQTHQEVPHGSIVQIEFFEDKRNTIKKPLCLLKGRIYIEKTSQKSILIGKKGEKIKKISEKARYEIEKLLNCSVYLHLTVHVSPNWTRHDDKLRKFGLIQDI